MGKKPNNKRKKTKQPNKPNKVNEQVDDSYELTGDVLNGCLLHYAETLDLVNLRHILTYALGYIENDATNVVDSETKLIDDTNHDASLDVVSEIAIDNSTDIEVANDVTADTVAVGMIGKVEEIAGFDINCVDENGATALIIACQSSEMAHNKGMCIAQLLISNGIDLNISDNSGNTALTIATRSGNIELVRLLLRHNVNIDINRQTQRGMTLLMIAIEYQKNPILIPSDRHIAQELVSLFLANNPHVNIMDNDGNVALVLAAKRNYTKIVNMLISHVTKHGEPKCSIGEFGVGLSLVSNNKSVLIQCCMASKNVANILLDIVMSNIDYFQCNFPNICGEALHMGIRLQRRDVVEVLCPKNLTYVIDGKTPLHAASEVNNEMFYHILKCHHAILEKSHITKYICDHIDIFDNIINSVDVYKFELLLRYITDPIALHNVNMCTKIINMFVAMTSNPNFTGKLPLFHMVTMLLKHCKDTVAYFEPKAINIVFNSAYKLPCTELLYALLNCDIDLNQKTNKGQTILHKAVEQCNHVIIKVFVQHKNFKYFNRNILDSNKHTVMDSIFEYLSNYSSDVLISVLRTLTDAGFCFDYKNKHNCVIRNAIISHNLELFEFVMSKCPAEQLNIAQKNILPIAAAFGNAQIVKHILLNYHPDINGKYDGKTALMILLEKHEDFELISRIFDLIVENIETKKHGLDQCDKSGKKLIWYILRYYDTRKYDHKNRPDWPGKAKWRDFSCLLKYFLDRSLLDFNFDICYHTPLTYMIKNMNNEASTMLLEYGANVDAFDPAGNTPLILAIKMENEFMIKSLLAYHANVNKCDRTKFFPLEYALATRYPDIVKLVLNHHSKPMTNAQIFDSSTRNLLEQCGFPFKPTMSGYYYSALQNNNPEWYFSKTGKFIRNMSPDYKSCNFDLKDYQIGNWNVLAHMIRYHMISRDDFENLLATYPDQPIQPAVRDELMRYPVTLRKSTIIRITDSPDVTYKLQIARKRNKLPIHLIDELNYEHYDFLSKIN